MDKTTKNFIIAACTVVVTGGLLQVGNFVLPFISQIQSSINQWAQDSKIERCERSYQDEIKKLLKNPEYHTQLKERFDESKSSNANNNLGDFEKLVHELRERYERCIQ